MLTAAARTVCNYRASVRPSVPSGCRTPLLQVCCCGLGGHEMSIDCCMVGGPVLDRRSAAAAPQPRRRRSCDFCAGSTKVVSDYYYAVRGPALSVKLLSDSRPYAGFCNFAAANAGNATLSADVGSCNTDLCEMIRYNIYTVSENVHLLIIGITLSKIKRLH